MKTIELEQKVRQLSPSLQREVSDFVDFLFQHRVSRKPGKMRFRWAGGLRRFRNQFTSLELQKKSLNWWSN